MMKIHITPLFIVCFSAACMPVQDRPQEASSRAVQPELRRIRRFDEWLLQTDRRLDAAQTAMLEKDDLFGLVPSDQLPILHPHGSIEVPREMLDRILTGKLSPQSDFQGWLDAGLYDPESPAQQSAAWRAGLLAPIVTLPVSIDVNVPCGIKVRLFAAVETPRRAFAESTPHDASWPGSIGAVLIDDAKAHVVATTGRRYTAGCDNPINRAILTESGSRRDIPASFTLVGGVLGETTGYCGDLSNIQAEVQVRGNVKDEVHGRAIYDYVSGLGCISIFLNREPATATAKGSLFCRIDDFTRNQPLELTHGERCVESTSDLHFSFFGIIPIIDLPRRGISCDSNLPGVAQTFDVSCDIYANKTWMLRFGSNPEHVVTDQVGSIELQFGSDNQSTYSSFVYGVVKPMRGGGRRLGVAASQAYTGDRSLDYRFKPGTDCRGFAHAGGDEVRVPCSRMGPRIDGQGEVENGGIRVFVPANQPFSDF